MQAPVAAVEPNMDMALLNKEGAAAKSAVVAGLLMNRPPGAAVWVGLVKEKEDAVEAAGWPNKPVVPGFAAKAPKAGVVAVDPNSPPLDVVTVPNKLFC